MKQTMTDDEKEFRTAKLNASGMLSQAEHFVVIACKSTGEVDAEGGVLYEIGGAVNAPSPLIARMVQFLWKHSPRAEREMMFLLLRELEKEMPPPEDWDDPGDPE